MKANVYLPKVLKQARVVVTVKTSGLWRVTLGLMLMRLGSRVAGFGGFKVKKAED